VSTSVNKNIPSDSNSDSDSDSNKEEKKKKEKEKKINISSEPFRLAKLLLDLILARKPNFKKPNLQAWAKHIDLMIRRDKRTPERIEAVMRWCQADTGNGTGFGWANNILSTDKLREKFDRLELDMQKRPGQQAAEPVRRDADGLTPRDRALKELQND